MGQRVLCLLVLVGLVVASCGLPDSSRSGASEVLSAVSTSPTASPRTEGEQGAVLDPSHDEAPAEGVLEDDEVDAELPGEGTRPDATAQAPDEVAVPAPPSEGGLEGLGWLLQPLPDSWFAEWRTPKPAAEAWIALPRPQAPAPLIPLPSPPFAEEPKPDLGSTEPAREAEGAGSLALAGNASSRPSVRYSVRAGAVLSPNVEARIARLAESYHRVTGGALVVTSGTRNPQSQAAAMHQALRYGANLQRLYREKGAVREVLDAYTKGRHAGKSEAAINGDIASVIERQIRRGVFVSAHLRAGAADIRSRGMSGAERRAFRDAAAEAGLDVLEESAPPHFHLQLL